ncbi:MAG: DUF1847 domain-containing protein [Dehalococcoidales bacterium]|nr:MAG: DUF1847 domain-containing protein [Dehalococcoidales bacterium]
MNIAVITENGKTVSQHFGRAPYYLVYTVEEGKIVGQEKREKAGHHTFSRHHEEQTLNAGHGFGAMSQSRHAQMASVIRDCRVVIAGGMGKGAFESLKSYNIDPVITDVHEIVEAVERYLNGNLPNLMERLHGVLRTFTGEKKMTKEMPTMCSRCAKRTCTPFIKVNEIPVKDEGPDFCPMKLMPDVLEGVKEEYGKPDIHEFARLASIQEYECYERVDGGMRTKNPRILELIQFAKKNSYRTLGLAFCGGLATEARLLTDILENKGFEVISVCCKVGAEPKESIGIKPGEKIMGPDNFESMCNPIAQAELLNRQNVDFVVLLGLCLGHDTLFIKYCKAPMTVIAVKDRVTGHNPLAPLYLTSSLYYSRLLAKEEY